MVERAVGIDWGGTVLFLVWLVLPPVYVVVIGRHYARKCQESTEAAIRVRDELHEIQDHLGEFEEVLSAHLRKLNARGSGPDNHGRTPRS
ncbi:hypothetical protein FHS29_002455 [Saccharothrix tamanrassetensis]|uniref:Uncharacterized protein n=1 Tax=Saccharothrix tamanrassetensis TaxID=1051531 RepID=A0A841CHN1_9PSEU|nr:hypothetical protein [Saccharothrix tamanrassetensis]MBB5955874.1 hypothetical protein [Saccharothrix tamanrassetensis]